MRIEDFPEPKEQYHNDPVISTVDEAIKEIKNVCDWRLENKAIGGWTTKCGLMYCFANHPKEHSYKFCPNCGKEIKFMEILDIDKKTAILNSETLKMDR